MLCICSTRMMQTLISIPNLAIRNKANKKAGFYYVEFLLIHEQTLALRLSFRNLGLYHFRMHSYLFLREKKLNVLFFLILGANNAEILFFLVT